MSDRGGYPKPSFSLHREVNIFENEIRVSEMAQVAKVPAAEPDDPQSGREN